MANAKIAHEMNVIIRLRKYIEQLPVKGRKRVLAYLTDLVKEQAEKDELEEIKKQFIAPVPPEALIRKEGEGG